MPPSDTMPQVARVIGGMPAMLRRKLIQSVYYIWIIAGGYGRQ
jgi:hypothetical protein